MLLFTSMEKSIAALDFRSYYRDVLCQDMMKKFSYKNIMHVPRLEKIVINLGLGRRGQDKNLVASAIEGLAEITGQHPCKTLAKQSIAGFKLREGMVVGLKVTLRGDKMYDFFKRFVFIAMPRIRDFRGVSTKSFDGHGNYSIGIKEWGIFPERRHSNNDADNFGLDVSFVTTAKTDEDCYRLLEGFSVPFQTTKGGF